MRERKLFLLAGMLIAAALSDPQGNVWYVDFDTGKIGVLNPGAA